ncbi:MAG: hypothetical protein P8177_11470 [Gemmatimonadota bacterium]|jgi:hypothetical protein
MERTPETRLFQAYWEDGTLDLVGGVALAIIGLSYVLELHVLVGLVLPVALLVGWGIRRRVVEPRAGYVEFSRPRRERSERQLVGAFTVGLGLLAVVVLVAVRGVEGAAFVDGLPAVLIAVGLGLVGWLTGSGRFGAYAALFLGLGAVTLLLGTAPGWPLVVGGAVVGLSGAVLFGRFLSASRRFEQVRS